MHLNDATVIVDTHISNNIPKVHFTHRESVELIIRIEDT